MSIEVIQWAIGDIAKLWTLGTPLLIVAAIVCWHFRRMPWFAPFWVLLACPVIVFLGLLGYMLIRTLGGSGPDWGFVIMGTMFMLGASVPLALPGLALLCAFPRKLGARWPIIACACLVSIAASVGGICYSVHLATAIPVDEVSATKFAENYLRSTSGGSREGFRHKVLEAMIKSPDTPSPTLLKIGLGLDAASPLWNELSRNPSLPSEVIEARASNVWIAGHLANSGRLSPEHLANLAGAYEVRKRAIAASSESTPENILEKLALDNDQWVRDYAANTLSRKKEAALRQQVREHYEK